MSDTNLQIAPIYSLYRDGISVTDTLPETERAHGINISDRRWAHIQVIPAGGADPTVAALWWSEEAQKFVQEHTPISKVGVGADTPFEFTVEPLGRIMFVAVTTLAAGTVKILIAGGPSQVS
jgi:hypothetical protein